MNAPPNYPWFSNKKRSEARRRFEDKENIVWLFYAAVEFGGWSGAHVDFTKFRVIAVAPGRNHTG